MDDEQNLDCSSIELALERHIYTAHQNKVQSLVELPPPPLRAQNSMGKGSMKNVQSPFQLPSSSAIPKTWTRRSSTKNGPSSSDPRSKPTSLISASRDWIGPNKHEKNEPNIPSNARSGSKRKPTNNDLQFTPHQNLPSDSKMIKKSVDELCCEICQVSCSSGLTLGQHLIGRAHKAKLKFMQMKTTCNNNGDKNGNPRCETCQIWCSDWDTMEMHLKGQKHKAKLDEINVCKRDGGIYVAKKPVRCELCMVNCMNDDLFEMHLKGRQHVTREELKRRGML